MREGTVEVNGIRFAYLEEGKGPLVLLLHGFPDVADTWEHQMAGLAASGYRAVAPYLRGYPPTQVPEGGYYDPATLTTDVRALVETLGDGEPCFLVGHDWGAAITYRTLAAHPELFRRAVTMAIPHPNAFVKVFSDPSMIHHWFHMWFFQMQGFAEMAVGKNDFAMIDYLWRHWSSSPVDDAHVAKVKRALAEPGALEASLAYYRAAFGSIPGDPALASLADAFARPIAVPTLCVIGADDPASSIAEGQDAFFSGPLEEARVAGAGHFVQRERPDEVTKLIVEWLGA